MTTASEKLYKGIMASAKTVKRLRGEMGITQEELARRLKVTRTAVAKWETGETNMRPGHAELLKRIVADHREAVKA